MNNEDMKAKRKDPRGRKSLGDRGRRITLAVKVSPRELRAWRKAARAAGLPLSTWLLRPRRDEMEGGQ